MNIKQDRIGLALNKIEELLEDQYLDGQILKIYAYEQLGKFEEAKEIISMIELPIEQGDNTAKFKFFTVSSLIQWRYSDFDNARMTINQAERVYTNLSADERRIVQPYLGDLVSIRGRIKYQTGKRDEALIEFERALEIHANADHKFGQAGEFNNIGVVFNRKRKHQEALEYYGKSAQYYNMLGNERGLTMVNSNLASVYIFKGEHRKALPLLEYVIDRKIQLGLRKEEADVRYNKAITLLQAGSFHDALEQARIVRKIYEEVQNPRGVAIVKKLIGNCLYSIGDIDQAIIFICEAKEFFVEHKNEVRLGSIYSELISIYLEKEDLETSLDLYNELIRIKDHPENQLKFKQITLQLEYYQQKSISNLLIFDELLFTFELDCKVVLGLQLIDILFEEYHKSRDDTILDKIEGISNVLATHPDLDNSPQKYIQVLVIQAKISLIKNQKESFSAFIYTANDLAISKNLVLLRKQVQLIIENYISNLSKEKESDFEDNNFYDRYSIANFNNVYQAIRKRRLKFLLSDSEFHVMAGSNPLCGNNGSVSQNSEKTSYLLKCTECRRLDLVKSIKTLLISRMCESQCENCFVSPDYNFANQLIESMYEQYELYDPEDILLKSTESVIQSLARIQLEWECPECGNSHNSMISVASITDLLYAKS